MISEVLRDFGEFILKNVYRNPRPKHISGVMRRLREEVHKTNPNTLIRLVHVLPAKMNEIYKQKEREFLPTLMLKRVSLHVSALYVLFLYFELFCKILKNF